MKHAKKIASLLLVLVMVLSMTVTVFAASTSGSGTDNNGKITINNTVKDISYSIYRIFDLESFSDTTPDNNTDGAYSYKVNSSWKNYFAEGAEGLNYVNIDANGYVTWKENADAAEFAKKALAYATAEATKITAVGTNSSNADNASVEFTSLPLGYYLVDSSLGALCALTTTNPETAVTEKNANPTLTKKVKENSKSGDEAWGTENDASITDTVEFKATIAVQGAAKGYVMHDQMDDGLTYKEVTKVTLNGTDVSNDSNANYTVNLNAAHTGSDNTETTHTFDVTFTDTFCNSLNSGDVIVVYYNATLNGNAQVKTAENNTAYLEYKDHSNNSHSTTPSETKTYTWEIPVLKYANGNTNAPLAGAKFTLYKTETTDESGNKTYSDPVKFKETTTTNIYQVDSNGTKEEIATDATGRFKLDGLDSGTYYLKETEAPVGYNKLNTVVPVTISSAGKINVTEEKADGATEIQVENKSGSELPETGGMGTTIFYVVGTILLVGAAVLLITKKRMDADK